MEGAMAEKTRCAYEGKYFDSDEFEPDGLHKNADPPHLLTGQVISTEPGGTGPLDVEKPQ
jgi:hypothetical protein